MKYVFALLGIAVTITIWNGNGSDKQGLIAGESMKILAFGDSLTYGFGAKLHESYPSVLYSKTKTHIINAGVNGDSSEEGLRRLPTLLRDSDIKLMILCFGGNDILQKKPMSQLKKNLIQMINMAKNRDIKVLLVSVPDIGLFGLSSLDLYDEVADEMDVPLLSGMLAEVLGQPSLKSDQIHPNTAGYKKMAEKIYEKLKDIGWI